MSILTSSPLSPANNEEIGCLSPTFSRLIAPLEGQLPDLTPLESGSNRPLDYTFAHQVRALVYYHTEAFTSGQDLLEAAHDDPFVRALMIPETGLGKSTFYEANATRGSQQMFELLARLTHKARRRLKIAYPELGKLIALDGSLIDACLSMRWAEYSSTRRKAKVHLGFDLNYGIPRCLEMTDGKGAERPFVSTLLDEGDTGVLDRGYVDYARFDTWIDEGKHFVVRLRKNAHREILESLPIPGNRDLFLRPSPTRRRRRPHASPPLSGRLQSPGQSLLGGHRSRGLGRRTDRLHFLPQMGNRNFLCLVETPSGRLPSHRPKSTRRPPPATGRTGDLSAVGALFRPTIRRTSVNPTSAATAPTHPLRDGECLSSDQSFR